MKHFHTPTTATVANYVAGLKKSTLLGPCLTSHTVMDETAPAFAEVTRPWPRAMSDLLEQAGIQSLYSHQAAAMDAIRSGRDVVVATPTASGKSLIYNLPVIERFLHDPDAKSLFLFPLKALAQDQLAAFTALTAHWAEGGRPTAAVYDGDTTPHFRKKIRDDLPTALFTNPEMLHLALLPHHHLWTPLFAGLSFVVVDEVHTYRGLLGTHMSQVFRRLKRIAALYGANPAFIFCSATVGNPAELAQSLTGLAPVPVLESGAPQGKRHYLFLNPEESPSSAAIKLLKSALARNLRTIVYCQSRRMTELISLWASQNSGVYAKRISAYRAGYLPEERREIEARMSSGELLAVISTSALELGIDIGTLDLCVLVGYPGTVMATLQRGGRVGRSSQESAVVLVAQEDALDQYIVRHPEEFFSRPPETAVLNPENPVIVAKHLECAAAELPLRPQRAPDSLWFTPAVACVAESLLAGGILLASADGQEMHSGRKRPQRLVSLRGSGNTVSITNEAGELVGSVDGIRALREAHPGAIYLHRGEYYEVASLDLPGGRANARACRVPWYTRPRSQKDTEILQVDRGQLVGGMAVQFGRLRVTDTVTGYERRATGSGQLLGVVPLDLPPQVFETEGFWFMVPNPCQRAVEEARMHFMGAIHALEHAVIALMPLLVMTDRNDLGGISKPMHLQTGRPTIFVYDGMPGGAGLSAEGFMKAADLFSKVLALIRQCPCELGCPSCVHSPKCGSGNRPVDKEGAAFVLEAMLHPALAEKDAVMAESRLLLATPPSPPSPPVAAAVVTADVHEAIMPGTLQQPVKHNKKSLHEGSGEGRFPTPASFAVVDVETRLSAQECGGWHKTDKMGVSVAVVYDSRTDAFTSYSQSEIPALAKVLASVGLVVGFNSIRFDYAVLAPHAPGFSFRSLPSLDMLALVHEQLSYRVSLDNLATATLKAPKSANGLMALQWWKEQRLDLIAEYCIKDVAITRDLYLFGREHGYLLFTNKAKQTVRVNAVWGQV